MTGGVRLGSALLDVGCNVFGKKYPELRAGGFVSPGQPRSVYGTIHYIF